MFAVNLLSAENIQCLQQICYQQIYNVCSKSVICSKYTMSAANPCYLQKIYNVCSKSVIYSKYTMSAVNLSSAANIYYLQQI